MFLDDIMRTLSKALYRYPDVLKYLYSRKIADSDIQKFGLGYSKVVSVPDDGSSDRKTFMDTCFRGQKFENKLVFPIKGALGQVVGLIGRSIETKEFKMYALDQAKFEGFFFGLDNALPHIYQQNRVFVVEGPFDCMALSRVLPNTVACQTAGLSDAQYEYLMMYCDMIITVFDSDKTGKRAMEKAQKRKNVQSIDFGWKDPAKCYEEYDFDFFKEYVEKKAKAIVF